MNSSHTTVNNELDRHSSLNKSSTAKPTLTSTHSKRPKSLHKLGAKQVKELGKFRRMQHIARQRIASSQPQATTTQDQEIATTNGPPIQQVAQPSSNPSSNRSNVVTAPLITKDTSNTQPPPAKTPPIAAPAAQAASNTTSSSSQNGNAASLTATPAPASSAPVVSRVTTQSTGLPQNQTLPGAPSQPLSAQHTPKASNKGLSALQVVPLVASIFVIVVVLGWCIAFFQKRARDRLHGARKVEKVNIKGPFKKPEENLTDTEPVFVRRDQKRVAFESLEITNEKKLPFGMNDTFVNSPEQALLISSATTPSPLPNLPNANSTFISINATDHSMYNPISPSPQSGDPNLLDYRVKGSEMEGKVFRVERTYQAVLADELIISVGDRIQVEISYDDGWCLGTKLDAKPYETSEQTKGVFPRDCVGAWPINSSQDKFTSSIDYQDMASSHQNSRSNFRVISSHPSLSPLNSSIFEKFPIPPGPHRVLGQQRVSSLFVDRTTQLFQELGNALGEPFDSNSPPR